MLSNDQTPSSLLMQWRTDRPTDQHPIKTCSYAVADKRCAPRGGSLWPCDGTVHTAERSAQAQVWWALAEVRSKDNGPGRGGPSDTCRHRQNRMFLFCKELTRKKNHRGSRESRSKKRTFLSHKRPAEHCGASRECAWLSLQARASSLSYPFSTRYIIKSGHLIGRKCTAIVPERLAGECMCVCVESN